MSKKLYVVTMYRFASKEKHSYVIGIFTSEKIARREAAKEEANRGGNKYWAEILQFERNNTKASGRKTILALPETI